MNNHNDSGEDSEALSAYERQQHQIEIAIAAAINGGSPERNSLSSFSNGVNSDEFTRRLIDAVKREPCLYNPSHEHYGNKHSSALYRATIWQRLCKELDYHDDPHSLQAQWKRLRDRYVREKRKRRGVHPELDIHNSRTFYLMRWIDDYLGDAHSPVIMGTTGGGNVLMNLPSTSSAEQYYGQNNHMNGASGGAEHGKEQQRAGHQKLGVQGAANGNIGGRTAKKNNNESNGSPSSTSSEISVGSAQFVNNGNNNTQHPQSQILLPQIHQGNASVNFGGIRQHQVMYKMKEELPPGQLQNELQTVGSAGGSLSNYQIISIPHSHAIQVPSEANYYQESLVPSSSILTTSSASQRPSRKKIALEMGGGAGQIQAANVQRGNKAGMQTQLVIEQDRILLNQTSGQVPTGPMIVHPTPQLAQMPARSASTLRLAPMGRGNAAEPPTPIQSTSTASVHQPQYILSSNQPQAHYPDQETAFIELIVRHLRNLNEDEKVVTKMNIQRILMDARFGRGACVRMFNDELAMEQQRHMQQQQQQNSVNSSRR